jgi:hypothetical protein
MTLWDKEKAQDDANYNDSKPNWLTDDEKARCYCDDRGWVLVHLNGDEEVLVASNTLNHSGDDSDADAAEKAAAVAAKAESLSDDDGDGIPQYQDPDDDDE